MKNSKFEKGEDVPQYIKNGRYYVNLDGKEFAVDRLVASTFVENPNPKYYKYVKHKDGNLLNNRADNLYWSETKY